MTSLTRASHRFSSTSVFRILSIASASLIGNLNVQTAYASDEAVVSGAEPAAPKTIPFEKGPYKVRVERSHFIEMKDGIRLSTDLYFPEGFEGKLPVIMERTPYDKAAQRNKNPNLPINLNNKAYYYASHGYVFAIQDRRGKFESEGQYTIGHGDVDDARDTFNWFGDQDWFNGRIGMIGCSIPGGNVIKAAQTRHKYLKGLVPQSAAFGHGTAGGTLSKAFLRGGVQNLQMPIWTHYYGGKLFFRPSQRLSREEYLKIIDVFELRPDLTDYPATVDSETFGMSKHWRDALLHLPLVDIDDRLGSLPSDWDNMASRAPMDPWWDKGDYLEDRTRVDGAALHINSWHDYGVNETLLQFNHFQNKARSKWARDNQYVIISPLAHCNAETVSSMSFVGERPLGDARFDFWGTYLRWFDYTLKEIDNGFEKTPKVQYYLAGANQWKSADTWPLPGTERTRFYLTSGGSANTRLGDGRLVWDAPGKAAQDVYQYDPANPVDTGFRSVQSGSFDMAALEMREDILVYSTGALAEPFEMTGKMRAQIWLSADVPDTDLAVKILDVYPDGRAFPIQESYLRLRYREGFDREVMLEPGEVVPVDMDLLVGANLFQKDHKIRIEITSSNFPSYARNLNTGGDNARDTEFQVATVTIHHGPETPSYIELPMIPASVSP